MENTRQARAAGSPHRAGLDTALKTLFHGYDMLSAKGDYRLYLEGSRDSLFRGEKGIGGGGGGGLPRPHSVLRESCGQSLSRRALAQRG